MAYYDGADKNVKCVACTPVSVSMEFNAIRVSPSPHRTTQLNQPHRNTPGSSGTTPPRGTAPPTPSPPSQETKHWA